MRNPTHPALIIRDDVLPEQLSGMGLFLLNRYSFRLLKSAAEGFKALGVVVSYTTDPDIQSSKKFMAEGRQTAAGVPLQCDEGPDFMTFRVGLFGLDKWHNVDRTVCNLAGALDRIGVVERVAETVT